MSNELNPYVGFRSFNEDHQMIFYGRTSEIRDLRSLVIAHPITLLYAQGGAGKTSLIRAGLMPKLREAGVDVLPVTRVQGPLPGNLSSNAIANPYVFHSLMHWIDGDQQHQLGSFTHCTLSDFLQRRPRPMEADGLTPRPQVIIFDQFEELFTFYPESWPLRKAFFEQLCKLLDHDPFIHVLLALREDYVAQLDPYASLLPERLRSRFRLEGLTETQALEAIHGPLQALHTTLTLETGWEKKLVDKLLLTRFETTPGHVEEIRGQYVEPVQLEVICERLWQTHHNGTAQRPNTTDVFDVNTILGQYYEDAIRAISVPERKVRRWFEKELLLPLGGHHIRNSVLSEETTTAGLPNRAVKLLSDTRHILHSEQRAGAHWYELAHDRFIEPILQSNHAWRVRRRKKLDRMVAACLALTLVGFAAFGLYEQSRVEGQANITVTAVAATAEYKVAMAKQSAEVANANLAKATSELQSIMSVNDATLAAMKAEATKEAKQRVSNLLGQGREAVYRREYADAIQKFSLAITIDPSGADSYLARGLVYAELKQFDAAIADFHLALKAEPNNFVAQYNIGSAYAALAAHDDALRAFAKAKKLDPANSEVYLSEGQVYAAQADNAQAIAAYKQGLRLNPQSAALYLALGQVYAAQEEYPLALANYDQAAQIEPENQAVVEARRVAWERMQSAGFTNDWPQREIMINADAALTAQAVAAAGLHSGRFTWTESQLSSLLTTQLTTMGTATPIERITTWFEPETLYLRINLENTGYTLDVAGSLVIANEQVVIHIEQAAFGPYQLDQAMLAPIDLHINHLLADLKLDVPLQLKMATGSVTLVFEKT